MALPITLFAVSTSPEIILVLINIAAFLLGQRRGVRLSIGAVRTLTPTAKEIIFSTKTPLRFLPGQYLEVHLPQVKPDSRGTRRSFSIIGIPGKTDVSIGVKFPEKPSSFKRTLAELQQGTILTATRVSGDFVLPKDPSKPLLFVAGGIGITPFVSHIRSLRAKGESRDIILLYAVSSSEELAYIQDFIAADVKVVVVSANINQKIEGVHYSNAPYVTGDVLKDAVVDVSSRYAYVSGPPLMVDVVAQELKKAGAGHVKCDYFSGY